jgi:type II secretory pathway component GspD/PulD (secretin)
MGELNIGEMFEELSPMVSRMNQNFFAQFPAANQIRVRETGGTLRIMRDLIERAKANRKKYVEVYVLKHVDSESFMIIARGQLDMEAGRDSARDDSLSITREPFGKRLFVRATDSMHRRFADVAKAIDVPAEQVGEIQTKTQRFQQYPILVDPELGYGMVEFVLEGRGAKMQQDKINNSIMVWGTEEDHQLVAEALRTISEVSSQAFDIIALEFGDAAMVLTALQNLLRQTGTDLKPDAPVVIADKEKNQIIVRGKPKDVEDIKRMVMALDATSKSESKRLRTDTRVISIDERGAEILPDILGYLLEGEGRKNPIQVIMPEERRDGRSRSLRGNLRNFNNGDQRPEENGEDGNSQQPQSSTNPFSKRVTQWVALAIHQTGFANVLATSTLMSSPVNRLQEDENRVGKNSQSPEDPDQYRAPERVESVPGSEIMAKFVEGKLILTSKDLDALDDLEFAIQRELGNKSELEPPKIYPITYRSVNEIKSVLESQFGLASSTGDGANPLGNIARNMLPIGGLLDGLMGGGAAGTTGSNQLEGDVKFNVYVPLNYLLVVGATTNDLDLIEMYLDILDQANPAHNPDLVGKTYPIKIRHRDPEDIKTIVEESIPDYIDKSRNEGPQQQNNEAARMMQVMQQLAGGGRGGGANGGNEQKEAKARLAVDKERKFLIVTGPAHIYEKVASIVADVDLPNDEKPRLPLFLDRPKMDSETLKSILESTFPGIEIKQNSTSSSSSPPTTTANGGNRNASGAGGNQGRNTAPNEDQMRQRAMDMMMRGMQQQGGGNRGGGGRGNQGGGGGFPGGGGFQRGGGNPQGGNRPGGR